jgi:hypothetical protein
MKYFIFANNNDLNNFTQQDLLLSFVDQDDIIITMNHCLPLNILLNNFYHNNIYHFCRQSFNRKIPYSGLHIIDTNKQKFSKIFMYPHPESIKDQNQKNTVITYIKDKTSFNISDFYHMPGYGKHPITKQTRQFLSERYNKITNMSIGLVVYLYVNQIKNSDDKIYLIGFTHKMNTSKHNPLGEADFFLREKENNSCRMIQLK